MTQPPEYPGPTPPNPGHLPPPPGGELPPPPSFPAGATPPPPPGPGAPAPGGYYGPPQANQKALWSMILGIVGLFCCGLLLGIPAIILGVTARKEIEQSGGMQTGAGQAKAGVILGIIAIVWSIIYAVLVLTGVIEFTFDAEGF